MRKKPTHYYPDSKPDSDMTTACGRDGHKTGGFIAFFFKIVKFDDRCKTCNKQFEKDQREKTNTQTTIQ